MTFRVGQKVVCIKYDPDTIDPPPLNVGDVYTVAWVGIFEFSGERLFHPAQASPDQHDATYLRGWNEGIERAVEALEKEGWYTPQETIRTLIETSPVPSAHPSPPAVARASSRATPRPPASAAMGLSAGGETLYAWPVGCRHPNSCNRHGECMYVDCVHLGKPIRASSLPSTDGESL